MKLFVMVEGEGDQAAVPLLVRRILHDNNIFDVDCASNPMKGITLARLTNDEQLSRYVAYLELHEADAGIIVVDNDDDCAKTAVRTVVDKITTLYGQKKVGVCLMTREYESTFLYSLSEIATKYTEFRWQLGAYDKHGSFENIRGAKQMVSSFIGVSKRYKETRDQARFSNAVDLALLRTRSRSFLHLERTVLWLCGRHGNTANRVYPA